MEDIIAYSIIAIIPVVVIYGAVLLRRYFVRCKERKLKLQQQWAELRAKQTRDREQQRIKDQEELKSIAGLYSNGVVGRQEYDLNTNTVRTSVHDTKTKTTRYVTTPAAQNVAPGTVLPQTAGNFGTDLLTIMGLAGLASSISSTPAHSKSTDFDFNDNDSQKSTSSSFGSSDSSSSWGSSSDSSSSSDSGPSSDW
jgi:DNA-binding protein H-NS